MTTLDLSSIIRGLREPVLPVGREGAVVAANPSENERLSPLAKANRALHDEQRWRAALESSANRPLF